MFNFVKRLAPFSKLRTRVLTSPALSSHQSFTFSFMRPNQLTQMPKNPRPLCYSFSSSQGFQQNSYEADLACLDYYFEDEISRYKALLNMYVNCKDVSLLEDKDIYRIIKILENISTEQWSQGNLQKAQSYLFEVLDLVRKRGWNDHFIVARSQTHLGEMYDKEGDVTKARNCFNEAIRICKLRLGELSANNFLFSLFTSLAKSYEQTNEKNKIYDIYRLAIENANVAPNKYEKILVEAYENLGLLLYLSGEPEKANDYLQKALEMTTRQFGEQSEQAFYLYSRIARVFQTQGNADKAFYYSEKALQAGLQAFPQEPEEITDRYSQLRAFL